MADLVFWVAEVIQHGDEVEVMCWTDPVGNGHRVPRSEHLVAWARVHGEADVDAVELVLSGSGLAASEVNGRTDPVAGRSWWRGIARDERRGA